MFYNLRHHHYESEISLLAALVCTVPSQQHQDLCATSPICTASLAVLLGFEPSAFEVCFSLPPSYASSLAPAHPLPFPDLSLLQ